MTQPFTAPALGAKAFNCVFCGAYAAQIWRDGAFLQSQMQPIAGLKVAYCNHCSKFSVWLDGQMVHPDGGAAPIPNPDLSADIRRDYEEARSILAKSPRGSAALLRLAIQKLCKELGEPGTNINDDIGSLVRKGLPVKVQQALDALRVIGNQAVHPGQLDLRDDPAIAGALFGMVNFIAEKMISDPKHVEELYSKIPPGQLAQIAKRDGTATS